MSQEKLLSEINSILSRIDLKLKNIETPSLDPRSPHSKPSKSPIQPLPKKAHLTNTRSLSHLSSSSGTFSTTSQTLNKKPLQSLESFQPSICKKSLKIAKKLTSSRERLILTPDRKQALEFHEFRPMLNKRTSRILKHSRRPSEKVFESLYEQSIAQRQKLENARKIRKNDDIDTKEFTFKPLINRGQKNLEGVIERNCLWLREKAEKLIVRTEFENRKAVEQCTFNPKTNERVYARKESAESVRGLEEFLDRQLKVKNSKQTGEQSEERPRFKDLTKGEYVEALKGLSHYLYSFPIK